MVAGRHKALLPKNTEENAPDEIMDSEKGDGLKIEFEQGSKNFIGGSDNNIPFPVNNSIEELSTKPFLRGQPSKSSDTLSNTYSKSYLYSLESRNVKEANKEQQHADSEDRLQSVYNCTDDQNEALDPIANEFIMENEEYLAEQPKDEEVVDGDPCSNGVAPLLHSSDVKEPTIDKEFEEYFSALMVK